MAERMGRQKHTIHGLVEFDITRAREKIRQYRTQTGEALSFSVFFLACLEKAIEAGQADACLPQLAKPVDHL